MPSKARIFLPFMVVTMGCKRVEEAPKEYETAVAHVFEHFADEDSSSLVENIAYLEEWLTGSNLTSAEEGLSVQNLPKSAVGSLEGHSHSVSGLQGVSLSTDSRYDTCTLMEALTQYSFARMMPDVYDTYDRQFDLGQDCISDRDCMWAEGSVYSVADWGILGQVTADRRIEYRWLETDDGWAFIQRWWLTEPSTGTRLGLKIQDQFYVGINFPLEQGTRRVHASWLTMEMTTGDASTGASNQLINNWEKDADELDQWIDDNL